jgi:hypothetical protein
MQLEEVASDFSPPAVASWQGTCYFGLCMDLNTKEYVFQGDILLGLCGD